MLKRKEKAQFENSDKLNRLVEGTKIVGDLMTDSNLRIDGEVVGNVFSRSRVEIGETGIVFGNINCLEADIEGKVEGSIDIEELLILRSTSKIIGDIVTARLSIEEGATFLGSCQMTGHEATKAQQHLVSSEENAENTTY